MGAETVAIISAIAGLVGAGTSAYSAISASNQSASEAPTVVASEPYVAEDILASSKDQAASLEAAAKKKKQSYAQIATSPGGILTAAPTEQKQLSTVLG